MFQIEVIKLMDLSQLLLGLALLGLTPAIGSQTPASSADSMRLHQDAVAGAPQSAAPVVPKPEDEGSLSPAPLAAPPVERGIHQGWHDLLAEFVHAGIVDYTGLAKQRPQLHAYLKALDATKPSSLSRSERTAFWINAYNAFTVELILDHLGHIEGIKDISSSKRWKAERWSVSGRLYSLDAIEHEILRPMGDARVHFALVCASFSCPDLRSEAYLGATLDVQLTNATRRFLANTEKGLATKIESGFFGGKSPNLYLSKIFDWFDDDFETGGRELLDFVKLYAPEQAVAFIKRHEDDLDLEYFDYSWKLNGR